MGSEVASKQSTEDPAQTVEGRTATMGSCRARGQHVSQRVGVAEQAGGKELNAT